MDSLHFLNGNDSRRGRVLRVVARNGQCFTVLITKERREFKIENCGSLFGGRKVRLYGEFGVVRC